MDLISRCSGNAVQLWWILQTDWKCFYWKQSWIWIRTLFLMFHCSAWKSVSILLGTRVIFTAVQMGRCSAHKGWSGSQCTFLMCYFPCIKSESIHILNEILSKWKKHFSPFSCSQEQNWQAGLWNSNVLASTVYSLTSDMKRSVTFEFKGFI